MKQLKLSFSEFKYELSIFAVLSMNFLLFFTKDDLMSDIMYPMHLLDVKIGLLSRTLAGSISGLLWEHPTKENVFFLHLIVVIISFALTAVFLGGCIKQAEEKSRKQLFIISFIVAVLPYGFMSFINLFELLDIYWLFTAALILLSAENKKTALLIPLFLFTGPWAHFSFVFAFMPVIYILFFNKCIKEKNKYTYIFTAVIIATSVGTTLYFFLTQRTHDIAAFNEYVKHIINKAGDTIIHFEEYAGISLRPYEHLHRLDEFSHIPESYPEPLKALIGYLTYAVIDTSPVSILCDFILASPIVLFFVSIWKKAMKITEDKKERFMYFLCLITPLVQVFACFTSSDTSRWLSLLVISQLFLLAIFIKERAMPVEKALDGIMQLFTKYNAVLIFVVLFYLSIVFVW